MVFGGIIIFFYFGGIKVEQFSGGLITGKIENPQFVPAFLWLIFLYNFYMFEVYLQREIELHNFKINNLNSFGIEIARYILKKEIGRFFQFSEIETYEPKNFVILGSSKKNLVECQFTLDSELKNSHFKELKLIPGLTLENHGIKFKYEISNADKEFYKENKNFIKRILVHEFMDFKFPKFYGVIVLLLVYFSFAKLLFTYIFI